MDIKQLIEQLNQLASTRGGKMVTVITLTLFAILATVRYTLWSGTLDPLEGGWEIAHNITVLISFLLLALIIASIIWPKKAATPIEETETNLPDSKKKKGFLENGRLRRWSNWWVLGWMLTIVVLIYAFGGMTIIKDLIMPSIQNIASTPFVWDTKHIANNILMPFLMTALWMVIPFIFYIDISSRRRNTKRNKDIKEEKLQ